MEFEIDRPEEIIVVRKIISSLTRLKTNSIDSLSIDFQLENSDLLRVLRITHFSPNDNVNNADDLIS